MSAPNSLRHLRLARDLTLEQLGQMVGTDASTIRKIEQGSMRLTDKWLRPLTQALGVTADAILEQQPEAQDLAALVERLRQAEQPSAELDLDIHIAAGLLSADVPDFGNYWQQDWTELCPAERLAVPDWVPDVQAGASAPVALTDWKVRAIKIVITMERRGYVTRKDFSHFKISMSRWTQGHWIKQDGRGGWVRGEYLPDFRAQHPVNFDQIEADYETWKTPAEVERAAVAAVQEAML